MKAGWMRAKALGVGARGRSGDDGEPQGVGARNQRGIAKQKIETGCALVFARKQDPQSVQYTCGLNRTVNGLQH